MDAEIGAAGDVDTAAVTMTYADGRIRVIKNSRRAVYGYDQRVELLGAEGLLQAENLLENTCGQIHGGWRNRCQADAISSLERYMPAYAKPNGAHLSRL